MNTTDSRTVQEQYESYPFPPLELGALSELKPVQADASFAHWYLLRHLPEQPLRILDAGCGTGFSTLKLYEANPDSEIVAVDFSGASLEIAQARLVAAGFESVLNSGQIRFIQANLETLPDLGGFDYIHSSGVLHHLVHPELGLAHLKRSLNPDGVAYLMVYSARARREIEDIQAVLYTLWQDPEDWQEGLKLCRRFFQNLPGHHRLKVFERQTLETTLELLGAKAANSHAFLVDTYLQRCEHLWTQPEWFSLLRTTKFQPGRWLDETSWDLNHYLPGMQRQFEQLSSEAYYELADRLRPAHNFALYLCHQEQTLPHWDAPTLKPDGQPLKFTFVTLQRHAEQETLDNGRGQRLTLNDLAKKIWNGIDGRKTWLQIWQELSQNAPHLNQYELERFSQNLLTYELVGQRGKN